MNDPRIAAIPDVHGHAKGEHRPFAEERPIAYSARMLFLWFYHACRRGWPRFLMVSDHINFLTFEDPGAVNTLRRALKLAQAGDLYGAAETAGVDVAHASVVSEGLRRGMRFSIGAEVDTDPRARPDAQNIVEAMRPDGLIRSVHFLNIDHPEKGADWPWPFDNHEFVDVFDIVGAARTWELYIEKLVDEIEKLPGTIVGHLYVPAKFGHWIENKKLEEYEDRVIEACVHRGMAIEFNTRFLYRDHPEDQKRQYLEAYRRLLRKARAKEVLVAVGSDAHSPRDLGGAFETVLKILDECRINELAFPVNGRLARVALRATREHLESARRPIEHVVQGSSISGFGRTELGLPEQAEEVSRPTGRAGSSRTARAVGPKRRPTDSGRTAASKSTVRRSAESAASSSRAKAAKAPKKLKKAAPKKKSVPAKKATRRRPAAQKRPTRKVAVKRAAKPKRPAGKPAAKKAAKTSRKIKTTKRKATKRR